MIDVRVLGPLEVECDGELVELGGRKQRAVLAVLILHAREPMSADRLADRVWDGEPPASADTTLRSYVSGLRKAIEPTRGEPRILRTTPNGYLLDVDDEQIDARLFERLVADGRDQRSSGDFDTAVDAWTRALERWRGEAFQDFAYDAFAQAEAARLTELRLSCTEELFEARLERGEHSAVVGDLEAFCASHPGREHALASRMLALYRCGRQEDALAAYEVGRRRLAEELGVDPSPVLRGLHEQIVRQDPGIGVPAAIRDSAASRRKPPARQTLTFLLGDVERSTSKLRELAEDYPDVLEEHRRLLKEALRSQGGRDVRTYGGDEVFAAFDVATDAVRAAVAAQLAVCGAGFDEERSLPFRMGIHTGEATYVDGEFVGLAVHLTSRIMDAAHGGQVLASQAAKELVASDEGIGFTDQGRHALKDFPDTVRLFQVTHPELPQNFPPLRSRADRRDNLPQRLTSFVGREQDLARIEAALDEARVVTLTGVGGVGKTRLAIETGCRLLERYPDGVWFCELAPVGNTEGLVHSVATSLGVSQQAGRSMRESLLSALAERDSLLILDNCEHLLGAVAGLVDEIVHAGNGTDVLSTSREALDVEGERTRPVRSLDASSSAVHLFEDRAQERRPDFRVDEANAADVSEICSKLDGIPLAIELAASRVTVMSPAQIAKRLDEGFHFLRSGRRAAVDRHRTLHGAINWSYDGLSESERLLFDRLSVFAGGFTLEAAEAVCGPELDLDVADGLASLVAKSLVDADVSGEEARYSLLETMRQYGQDRLAERGDAGDTLRAHAAYFAALLEGLIDTLLTGRSEGVVHRLRAEFDNIRAANAWARELSDVDLALRLCGTGYGTFTSQFPEIASWAEGVLAMPGADEHPSIHIVLLAASQGAVAKGDLGRANELTARALERSGGQDDPRRGQVLGWANWLAHFQGRVEEARRNTAESLRIIRRGDGLAWMEGLTLGVGSMAETTAGDHDAAIEMAEQAVEVTERGTTAYQGVTLYCLGEALLAAGRDLDRARDCLERSIDLCRVNDYQFWVGVALLSLASLRDRQGDHLGALPIFGELVERWRLAGDWARQWLTLRNLAELLGRLECDQQAAVLLAASGSAATAPPEIGQQGERLAELRGTLTERMGEDTFAAVTERARAMSDAEVVAYARAEIERILELDPAEVS